MGALELEPGSFRDPDSRVFLGPDGVFRALSEQGLADWAALAGSPLLARLVDERRLVATELLDGDAPDVPDALPGRCAGVLRHERLPFVSYPYEWSFSMLRDAALLQLELMLAALDEDLILKDASPYNVGWRGSRPVFMDVGSFERLRPGEPWAGYRQFCMLFLYPLMLQAYRGVPFQPWLRGSLEGIAPAECRALVRGRDLLRRGVLAHVVLHARLERRYADRQGEARRELSRAGFRKEMIRANVERLHRTVRRLRWDPPETVWTGYGETTSYDAADARRKEEFVAAALAELRPRSVWDVGIGDGRFSRMAAEHARTVVAIDADRSLVDRFHRRLRDEGDERILPLVVDVTDPSPGLGWRGRERRPLADRGRPDVVLCLALVHHLAIAGNVPLPAIADWLADLGAAAVVEFVAPEDPMAARLLDAKRPGAHPGYDAGAFERALRERFELRRSLALASGRRTLHLAVPRG